MRPLHRVLTAVAVTGLLVPSACASDDGEQASTDTSVPPVVSSTTLPGTSTVPPTVEADLTSVRIAAEDVVALDAPIAMATRSGDDAIYIAEQSGRIRRLAIRDRTDRDGNVTSRSYELDGTFLDLRDSTEAEGEQGLLGLTFSPDGRRVVVDFTDNAGDTNVEEFEVDGSRADTGSRRRLLFVDQPFGNHNGGQVLFGPDGFLYVGLGDGGGAGDPEGNGQDPRTMLGSILRIDPDAPDDVTPYAVPSSNPFADGVEGAPEVWLFGVRNPWRFTFDRETDDLWVADVGQEEIEEITWLPASFGGGRGANLGWNDMEGNQPFAADGPPPGHVAPIHTYDRTDTAECSVVGGYVYRGSAIPALRGAYVYGDFCSGEVRALAAAGSVVVAEAPLGLTIPGLQSFGEDADGELWALSADGAVRKLVPAAAPADG